MSKPLTSRLSHSKGPFPALIPVGQHAGRPGISLRRPITLIGSGEKAHVHLTSRSVDPVHALIVVSNGRVYVRDLASHAGVQVNDQPVLEAELGRDDVLKVGSFQFRVSLPAARTSGVRELEAPPARYMLDGQTVAMDGHVLLIGRRAGCDLAVTDPMTSRVHAAVISVNGQYVARDLGSRAGTMVNVDKIHEQVLESGDEIHVGSHAIYVQIAASAAGQSAADLIDLEDSLAAVPHDAVPAVAAPTIDEPDPLDLHLPTAEEDAPVAPAAEPAPELAADVSADEDEHAPIPLDLDLDLSTPEPVAAVESAVSEEHVEQVAPGVELEPPAPAPEVEAVEPPASPANEEIAIEPEAPAPIVAAEEEVVPAGTEEEPVASAASEAADEDDDLLKLVAEEIGEQTPADSLSGTPFDMAKDFVVDPRPKGNPVEEAGGVSGGASLGFAVGPNQALYVMGSPVGWHDTESPAPSFGGSQFEVSLSGVHGTVEGVEQLPQPQADEPAPEVPSPHDSLAEVPLETGEGVASVAADTPPVPESPKEQLLGFIRIEEMTPGKPIRQTGPIEPVPSVVESANEPAPEPAIDLPLNTDAPSHPGEDVSPPTPADSPDSLHAVKPPPAAYRITRGLSSLTGGGRAVDVFSQLPVLSDDPVLGKVSGPAQIPPVGDPALSHESAPPPTHDELADALRPHADFDSPEDAGDQSTRASQPRFIRKLKRLFRERGGTMSLVAATLVAGAAAYGLTPSRTLVRAEINYRNFTRLSPALQRAIEVRQQELLTDPSVLASAVEEVSIGPDAPGPGFLASPVALSKLLDRADANLWPDDRPGTLALSIRSSNPRADVARLSALVQALVDAPANKRLVTSAETLAERAARARTELAALDQDIQRLQQDQIAAQARLASADDRGDVSMSAAPEPSVQERAWRTASLATLKAQSDLADLVDRKIDAADPQMRNAKSKLAAARADEAVARDRFITSQQPARLTDKAEHHVAMAAQSLRDARAQRTAKEAEAKQLQSDADAATYPELPKSGAVWTNRLPNHRNLYAVAAAAVVGLSLSAYRAKRFG